MKSILFIFSLIIFAHSHSKELQQLSYDGSFVRGVYNFSSYGTGKHQGYISIFNLKREQIESLLPPQFGLAKMTDNSNYAPLVVLWGEMIETSATVNGILFPYDLSYREIQFYIPGVFRKNGDTKKLRTYVPRILLDEYEPEVLGRKFYYKKIQLDHMYWKMNEILSLNEFGSIHVIEPAIEPFNSWSFYQENDKIFRNVLNWLTNSDIIGENGENLDPRCSGFRWTPGKQTLMSKAVTELQLRKDLVPNMSPELRNKPIISSTTFVLLNWFFDVNYNYTSCP